VRGALDKVDGVTKVNIKAGDDPNFTVEYDAAKIKPEAILELIHKGGEEQVKIKA
jgi:copper chaperone CopZ